MESHQVKRAVLYCRVSTKEQAEEGNSLVTQEKNCREFAQKNGYEVAATFIEQGESAKTTDRTELKKLMSFCALKKNRINAVIAYKLDRISRNTDDYSQIRILLKRYGVEIKSTSEYFEDTPAGRFMENIIANVAQFDNDVRTERCIGGMKEAAKEGRYVWRAPFGYNNLKINGKSTIALNEDAPVIKALFDEVALNRYSLAMISRLMFEKGLKAKNGKPFTQSYFYSLLRNEVYVGIINKFGERTRGLFEPIVEESIFWKVQEVLSKKARSNTVQFYRGNPDFPLRKYITHTNGRKLTGYWAKGRKKKYAYYSFHTTKLIFPKEKLETNFAKWISQFKISPDNFEILFKMLANKLESDRAKFANSEAIDKQIAKLKAKQDLIVEKNISGVISDEIAKNKLSEISTEIYDAKEQLEYNGKMQEININESLRIVREILFDPGKIWLNSPAEVKVKLQWFYFPHGIEYAENKSRTTKICSLFKGNSDISPLFSSNVHRRISKSNTTSSRISKEADTVTLIQEIQKLADIIKNKESKDESQKL